MVWQFLGRTLSLFGCLILIASAGTSAARADLVVTITGQIADGQLNGDSLNGQSFVMALNLASGTDLLNADDSMGFFAVSSGTIQFSAGTAFTFDPSQVFFGQSRFGDPGLQVGIVDQFNDLAQTNQLGYSSSTNYSNFDPNQITPVDSFAAFEGEFANGAGSVGPATYVNGGDTLEIAALGLQGASFSAVPEPAAWPLLAGLSGVAWVVFRRRRRGKPSAAEDPLEQ